MTDTSKPVQLTHDPDGSDSEAAWSPDGRSIAFLRRKGARRFDLMTIPALGGVERKVLSPTMDDVYLGGWPRLAWAPDGNHIFFTQRVIEAAIKEDNSLFVVALDTGQIARVTMAPGVFDSTPAITRDGKWLAFTRQVQASTNWMALVQKLGPDLVPEGEPLPVPNSSVRRLHSLTWSPDGRRLIYVDGNQLMEWDRNDAKPRTVYTAATAPNGLAMYWGHGEIGGVVASQPNDRDLWMIPLDPKTHRATGVRVQQLPSNAVEQNPGLSADGLKLAFASDRTGLQEIWIAAADGSDPRMVTDIHTGYAAMPRWSPDSRALTFHTAREDQPRQVNVLDLESGLSRVVANGCCGRWSGDGAYLYFVQIDDHNSVARVRADGGEPERLFQGEWPVPSVDGRWILYSKSREPGIFRRLLDGNPADNPEEKLVDDFAAPRGGFEPSVDGMFYVSHNAATAPLSFNFYDYGLKRSREVAPAPANTSVGIAVTGDGRQLWYCADAEGAGGLMVWQFTPAN